MLVPVVAGRRGPLLPSLTLSGSQFAVQASLRQVTRLDGHRQRDVPDAVGRVPSADTRRRTIATRILIIDDNEGALHTFAWAFRQGGFEVSEAVSGAAGLALARGGGLHAVVADQCLPDLTGLEVLARLRALGCMVPVVMMSGWPTPDLRTRAHELSAYDFLAKPVWADDLLQVVKRAVQVELAPVDPDVIRRAEPASQAMSEVRQFAAGLADHGAPTATSLTRASVADAHRWLLHKLIQVVVCPRVSVREFLAIAEAIRRVVRAPDQVSPSELITAVLEALARVELAGVRRPLHAKVVEALAHLASLEGQAVHLLERDLADAVSIGLSRLSGLLHPQTGLDLRRWKRGLRMRQAAHRLAGTDKDVSQVAAWLGCKYASQFDDDFHELFGLTSREFRNALRASAASC